MTSNPAYYKIRQPVLLSGIIASMSLPANQTGTAVTVQISIYRTPSGFNSQTSITPISNFFVNFNNSTTLSTSYSGSSQQFGTGDLVHAYLNYYGGFPYGRNMTVQLDMF